MIQITTLHHLHLWIEPIEFRKGLDALIGLCRKKIGSPYDGTIFAFRILAKVSRRAHLCYNNGYYP